MKPSVVTSTSTLVRSFRRVYSSGGSASPAESATRTEEKSTLASFSWPSIWLSEVGTRVRKVGRCLWMCAKSTSGVGFSGKSTVLPPASRGKRRLVPSA